jgi:hypothetical protein
MMKKFIWAVACFVVLSLGLSSCKAKKVDCPAYGKHPVSSSQRQA